MTRRSFSKAAGMFAATASAARAVSTTPVSIGTRRELFVDRDLIDTLRDVDLRLATPVDAGPVLQLNKPWERSFSTYTTILQDGNRFRIYYRGTPVSQDGGSNEVTCYAESNDGLHWSRPDLGIYEIAGEKNNNVILAHDPPFSHNFTPFIDTRPGVNPDERFKALAGYAKTGLVGFVSADGIHWKKLPGDPALPPPKEFALDSQNIAFWSAHENEYVLYYRTWKKIGKVNYRWTSRAVSSDFRHFEPSGEMDYGDAPPQHLYTNQTSAYFRAPHIYIGLCARFMPGRQVLTEEQAKAIQVNPNYFKDCSDAVLISSRGGNHYSRTFLEAFLRPGIGLENWVSRSNYPALNLMQTGPSTMSFLVNRNYGQPTAYLRRYELRLDGFASAHAGFAGGELITRPLLFEGSQLELNYSTSAAGSIHVELQDASGTAATGFTLADSRELIGDEIARVYDWKNVRDLSAYRGKPVRLRFQLKDADLFSYRFVA
ncbi:MAG TPA: hypothetical protein VGL72_26870 [Bryobacteraceae bacterium]